MNIYPFLYFYAILCMWRQFAYSINVHYFCLFRIFCGLFTIYLAHFSISNIVAYLLFPYLHCVNMPDIFHLVSQDEPCSSFSLFGCIGHPWAYRFSLKYQYFCRLIFKKLHYQKMKNMHIFPFFKCFVYKKLPDAFFVF